MAAPPPGATPADAELALRQHLAAMATAAAVGLIAPTAHGEDGDVTRYWTGTFILEDPTTELTSEDGIKMPFSLKSARPNFRYVRP